MSTILFIGFFVVRARYVDHRRLHDYGFHFSHTEGLNALLDALVPVFATETVAAGGFDFDHIGGEIDDGDIERAAAEVIDDTFCVGVVLKSVGETRSCWLVDDPLDVQAGDFPGGHGGLSLPVSEVRRDGNDGIGDTATERLFGVAYEPLEDERGDLGRGVVFSVEWDQRFCGPCERVRNVREQTVG